MQVCVSVHISVCLHSLTNKQSLIWRQTHQHKAVYVQHCIALPWRFTISKAHWLFFLFNSTGLGLGHFTKLECVQCVCVFVSPLLTGDCVTNAKGSECIMCLWQQHCE